MDEAARPRRELRRAEHRLTYLPGGYLSAYPARLRAVPARPPGGCAAGAGHSPLLRSPETAAARSRVSSLSPRELEIAQLAAARRTNAEIAEALHLSEATVKNHLKRIFDKLGLDGGARGKRMLLADVLPKISP